MGEEEGGGFEELEEIDWLFGFLISVERCVKMEFCNALDNTEKRGGQPQELDDLVHKTFSRAEHKKDVKTWLRGFLIIRIRFLCTLTKNQLGF